MERNVENSFTNIPRKTNFKKRDEDLLLDAIEPQTSLGFLSTNRNADISDLLYIRDALSNEKSIEGLKKVKEDEELLRFRTSSSSRPAASQQSGIFHLKKEDSKESAGLSSQIKLRLTKKRKITVEGSESLDKNGRPSSQHAEQKTPQNIAIHVVNCDVVVPCPSSVLSSLVGIYSEEDTE